MSLFGVVGNASNVIQGENPPYGISDFLEIYPQFERVPEDVLKLYVKMADASLNIAKWDGWWIMAMGLYMAHFCTLWLQDYKNPAGTGMKGLVSSKSVDGAAISYDHGLMADLEGWAAWKLTSFGVQLATMAKLVGLGGMYVR